MTRRLECVQLVCTAAVSLVLLLPAVAADATPFTGKDIIGPGPGFKKGSTITVYVEVDPNKDNDRTDPAIDGINGWKQPLKDKGNVTLNVVKLNADGTDPSTKKPPDFTKPGTVHVVWEPEKTIKKLPGADGAQAAASRPDSAGEDDGNGHMTNAESTVGGVIHLHSDATANKLRDKTEAKKNAAHEMGHIIGLDHENLKKPTVMNGTTEGQPDDGSPSEADKKELGQIYGFTNTLPTSSVITLADGQYRYAYTLDYISGVELPLFQVGLGRGATFTDPLIPFGWKAFQNGNVATFEVAAVDFVRYLGPDDPTLSFAFTSKGAPALEPAWIGETTQIVGPAAVPEPNSLILLLAGIAAGGLVYPALRRTRSFSSVIIGTVISRARSGAVHLRCFDRHDTLPQVL